MMSTLCLVRATWRTLPPLVSEKFSMKKSLNFLIKLKSPHGGTFEDIAMKGKLDILTTEPPIIAKNGFKHNFQGSNGSRCNRALKEINRQYTSSLLLIYKRTSTRIT